VRVRSNRRRWAGHSGSAVAPAPGHLDATPPIAHFNSMFLIDGINSEDYCEAGESVRLRGSDCRLTRRGEEARTDEAL
jgi:hypothetical protein